MTPDQVQELKDYQADLAKRAAAIDRQRPLQMFADLDFADGTFRFHLQYAELKELEAKTSAGPMELLNRLSANQWRQDDVGETIRLGLIGGGMAPVEALRLVRRYVHERPDWLRNIEIAKAALMAVIFGFDPPSTEGNDDGSLREPESGAGEAGGAAA